MKTCKKCGIEKPFSDYYESGYVRKDGTRGLMAQCKQCYCDGYKKYRSENRDHYNEITRRRQRKAYGPKRRAIQKAYVAGLRQTDEGRQKLKKWRDNYQKKHSDRIAARSILGNAVASGRIEKPPKCQECGSGGSLEAHHHDYAKPLDVVWLCQKCHGLKHRR